MLSYSLHQTGYCSMEDYETLAEARAAAADAIRRHRRRPLASLYGGNWEGLPVVNILTTGLAWELCDAVGTHQGTLCIESPDEAPDEALCSW